MRMRGDRQRQFTELPASYPVVSLSVNDGWKKSLRSRRAKSRSTDKIHETKKPRDQRPWFPTFSSARRDQMVSIFPAIEERGRFRQFFLQVLHLAECYRSGLPGFVALLLGAS